MRIQFIQDLFDYARGKTRAAVVPVTPEPAARDELDALFAQFEVGLFTLHGRQERCLSGVNADPGVTERTLSLLCEAFPGPRDGVKVLDVGCGRKNQGAFLRALGFQAHGVDFDIEADTDRVKFHDLNAPDELPFPPGTFDAAVCQEIVEHIENPWAMFRKVKRVLRLGGTLIVTTPNISSLESRKRFAVNDIGFFPYFDADNLWQHINPIPYWEMTHIATFNGFEPVGLTGSREFHVHYRPRGKGTVPDDLRKRITLQNNPILHHVFRKRDEALRTYSPVPTHTYVWPTGKR